MDCQAFYIDDVLNDLALISILINLNQYFQVIKKKFK